MDLKNMLAQASERKRPAQSRRAPSSVPAPKRLSAVLSGSITRGGGVQSEKIAAISSLTRSESDHKRHTDLRHLMRASLSTGRPPGGINKTNWTISEDLTGEAGKLKKYAVLDGTLNGRHGKRKASRAGAASKVETGKSPTSIDSISRVDAELTRPREMVGANFRSPSAGKRYDATQNMPSSSAGSINDQYLSINLDFSNLDNTAVLENFDSTPFLRFQTTRQS